MKTISPPDGYEFQELLTVSQQCLFVVYKEEDGFHIAQLYDPSTESYKTPICKYPSTPKDIKLKFDFQIFEHKHFENGYYDYFCPAITTDEPLLLLLPYFNKVSKQLAFNPFTTEKTIIDGEKVLRLDFLARHTIKYFYCSKKNIFAFLADNNYMYNSQPFAGLDINLIQQMLKSDTFRYKSKILSNQVAIFQPNYSSEIKVFDLDFEPLNIIIHPVDSLAITYNKQKCTIIDLEI